MAKPKTIYDYAGELNPPKFKVWVTPKMRIEAAKALGLSKKPEAAEPLLMALPDKAVRDAVVEALASVEIPGEHRAAVAKGLLNYIRERENDFIASYFDKDKNPELMALCPEQKGHPILSEPESYLAGALSMVRQLSAEKAKAIEDAQAQGLEPYSRRKFRFNAALLSRLNVFLLSPELENIDRIIALAESVVARLTGKKAESFAPKASSSSSQSATDVAALSDSAVAEFVEKGLERRHSVTTAILETPRLLYATAKKIEEDNPQVGHEDAARMAGDGLSMECLHCGPLQKAHQKRFLEAVSAGYASDTPLSKLSLDRGNAGVLATGRCPGCDDTPVKVTLDRNWIMIPEKPSAGTAEIEAPAPAEQSSFDVVYSGEILEGHDPAAVRQKLAALFKTDTARIEVFFSGQPRAVKKGLDRASAEKLVEALAKIGAKARMS